MASLLRFGRPMGAAAAAVVGLGAVQRWQPYAPPAQCADAKRLLSTRDRSMSAKDTKLFSVYKSKFGTKKELTLGDIKELFKEFKITNEYLVGRLFTVMDADGGGTVDIKELSQFVDTLSKGSVQVKTRFLFDCCDIDKSGNVDQDHFRSMIKNLSAACFDTHPDFTFAKTEFDVALYHDIPVAVIEQVHANRLTHSMFLEADKDKSGGLDFKEFNFWVTRGGKTVNSFLELFQFFEVFSSMSQ